MERTASTPQMMARHVKDSTRFSRRTVAQFVSELRSLGIADASKQIASTIVEMRAGEFDSLLGKQYDWTTTRIIPVVFIAEAVSLVAEIRDELKVMFHPITGLPIQDQIVRPRILDIRELEMLACCRTHFDTSSILLEWASNVGTFDKPLLRHLNVAGIRPRGEFLMQRVVAPMRTLANRCGIDPSKLDFG